MASLYPDIRPYCSHSLEVGDGHILYLEESGNPRGVPVVFLHGGPGASVEGYHRRFFDPNAYRIIMFDQRGCGRSRPHAALEANTTQALVADLEVIREYLGVTEWVLCGGSWGAALALVYAEHYPQRTLGLILRGVFLATRREVAWCYQEGASRLFPDYWQDFVRPIPEPERGDLVAAYARLLSGDNELARMAAAKAWATWEARIATMRPSDAMVRQMSDPFTALSLARIESHYFRHDCFLEPEQILRDVGQLKSIPGVIIHGRYDMVCPLESAWRLHRSWSRSQLRVLPEAGHAASEPAIVEALVAATDAFNQRLG